ncbi:MAG: Cystathionine beta-synthase [candidate division TM6 bacterium GW2011_GWF2_38_10]|nr:MAG: Cystathionine beta-synthase [candidate division TM6 bacterium GW2011_GWF2_38_10]
MAHKQNYKKILECIGSTPLIQLDLDVKPTVLAKLDFYNPGGSIKDRSALFMVEQAEKDGCLQPGGTIIEASSGNQGIALAMIGAVKGYRVIITVPDRTAIEKVAILRAYGAEVHVCLNTDDLHDPRGYHAMAEHLYHTIPGAFMPNQYFNVANPAAHYATTGPEIWQQTNGTVTHFICGAGSCGTISGTGRYLKEQNPGIKVIGVDAATSLYSSKDPKAYLSEGIGIDVISDTFAKQYIDEIIPIVDADAFAMTRRLAKKYGFLVGISSGAVMHVALEYAKTLTEDDVLVVIFADSGKSYLDKVFINPVDKKCMPAKTEKTFEEKQL